MNTSQPYKRYFRLADFSVEVRSDLPITDNTFAPKFSSFAASGPLKENIILNHHFTSSKGFKEFERSKPLYFRPPWAIYQHGEEWIYQWIEAEEPYRNYYQTVVANKLHTCLDIYNDDAMREKFLKGGLNSLTMFPTDQILVGSYLAHRSGCIMHSLGIILDGKGYLFVGHSDAGKSTMACMMQGVASILCDDRNIIQKNNGSYRLAGTWSHGDVPDVSSETVPLKAIFFLKQSDVDCIEPIQDEVKIFESLLACLIRPLETRCWWDKSLEFLSLVSSEVTCCDLQFTKSGRIVDVVRGFK